MQLIRRSLCPTLIPALAATFLAGCNPKPPSCADEQTLTLVRSTLIEYAQKTAANFPLGAEIIKNANFQGYLSGLKITISDITSDGYDSNAKKYSCHAQVSITANQSPDNLSQTIDYDTQATEDSGPHKWLLQLKGETDLINRLAQAASKTVPMQGTTSSPKPIEIAPGDAVYLEKQSTGSDPTPIRINTRFGTLSISTENKLLLNGRPTVPPLDGNNDLTFLDMKSIGNQDIVLIQNTGGTACPALFDFVQLSQSGVVISKEFGTCSDTYQLEQTGNKLTVTMPGFLGHFESEKKQIEAAKQKHVFTFENGVLSNNGKPM